MFLYMNLQKSKVFSSVQTFKWHYNNCRMHLHVLLLLTYKLEMQMPYIVVYLFVQQISFFFISLRGITLSKIIGPGPMYFLFSDQNHTKHFLDK